MTWSLTLLIAFPEDLSTVLVRISDAPPPLPVTLDPDQILSPGLRTHTHTHINKFKNSSMCCELEILRLQAQDIFNAVTSYLKTKIPKSHTHFNSTMI